MAITKLMHVKERKSGGSGRGMYECIDYVLNEEKTEHGYWVGGNAGTHTEDVYHQMMETKKFFGKLDGRQCYHFVISFSPGETDAMTCYNVAQDFCEEYLGDKFDYVFAVHTDHKHIHAHIVFNSVDRLYGYKYHYRDGDWQKLIQPVTDRICQKYHLNPLTYDIKNKKGMNYAAWKENREPSTKEQLQNDIDEAISRASSYDDFLRIMSQKYTIRRGFSDKWNSEYLAFKNQKMDRARRNYVLGKAYTVSAIQQRIIMKNKTIMIQQVHFFIPRVKNVIISIGRGQRLNNMFYISPYQKKYLKDYWAIKKSEHKFSGGKEMWEHSREADQALSDLRYLVINNIKTSSDLVFYKKTINEKRKELEIQSELLKNEKPDDETKKIIQRYQELQKLFEQNNSNVGALENEMDLLEEQYPIMEIIEHEKRRVEKEQILNQQIRNLKKESANINRIYKNNKKGGGITP